MRTTALAGAALLLAGPALAAGGGGGDHHGTPWMAIGQHAFNLAVLLGFFAFILRKRIPDALRARRAAVVSDIDAAKKSHTDAKANFEALEQRLAGFEQQLATMRTDAESDALAEREIILAKADAGAAAIGEGALRSIAAETRRARQALRADAAALAVQVAAEQIKSQFTADDDQRLTGEFLETITRDLSQAQGADHG